MGFLFCGSVQLLHQDRLDHASTGGSSAVFGGLHARTLNGQSLVHHRASASNELKIRDGASAGRMVGGGGQRPKGSR